MHWGCSAILPGQQAAVAAAQQLPGVSELSQWEVVTEQMCHPVCKLILLQLGTEPANPIFSQRQCVKAAAQMMGVFGRGCSEAEAKVEASERAVSRTAHSLLLGLTLYLWLPTLHIAGWHADE